MELDIIAQLLSTAADEFGEQSCNDFPLPLTDEHKAIAIASIRHQVAAGWEDDEGPESWIADVDASTQNVEAFNNWLASYFSQRCKLSAEQPLSEAEIGVVAELLGAAADLREEVEGDDPDDSDCTLTATPAHKALIAAAIEHRGARGWKAAVKKIHAAKAEVTAPDAWALRYCSDRCKGKAAPPAGVAEADTDPRTLRLGISPKFPSLQHYLET